MPRFRTTSKDHKNTASKEACVKTLITKAKFKCFDLKTLGLGDISQPAKGIDTIAAVFDLEGFTKFCSTIDPHLSVPQYLQKFLEWIMLQLREVMIKTETDTHYELWAPLPYYVKYLGDGLLVLWDCKPMSASNQRNIIIAMRMICNDYRLKFLPTIKSTIPGVPKKLRCGLAKGTAISVGHGEDYVGSCINMAARLQKLPGISFSFNRRGFNLNVGHEEKDEAFAKEFSLKEVSIRGIGDSEIIGVLASQFARLNPKDKKFYKTV